MRGLIRHPAVQTALARLLGLYLAFVIRTSRWRLLGAEAALAEVKAGRPVILAFWHERLPMVAALREQAGRAEPAILRLTPRVLVSQHRDGRFIGAAVERFGLAMIYGSSRRGGAPALIEMLRALRAGDPVVITPDGPRGPRRQAAAGVAQLAALSGAKVVAIGAATSRHRLLGSWDRMMLPLPFGRAVLTAEPPIAVGRQEAEAALPAIAAALDAACAAADAAVGVVTRDAPVGRAAPPADAGTDVKPAEAGADMKPAEAGADMKPAEAGADRKPAEAAPATRPAEAG